MVILPLSRAPTQNVSLFRVTKFYGVLYLRDSYLISFSHFLQASISTESGFVRSVVGGYLRYCVVSPENKFTMKLYISHQPYTNSNIFFSFWKIIYTLRVYDVRSTGTSILYMLFQSNPCRKCLT